MEKTFTDRLMNAIDEKQSIVCAGIDPQFKFIPVQIRTEAFRKYGRTFEGIARAYLDFNQKVINAVEPFVVMVKPQFAFYLLRSWGVWAFEETVDYAKKKGLLVGVDAKVEDGGPTAEAYANSHLGEADYWPNNPINSPNEFTKMPVFNEDAVTITTWIDNPMMKPFIETVKNYGKGVFVVDKTSFKPASRMQDTITSNGIKNWELLATFVDKWGIDTEGERGYRNIGVVFGATFPADAPRMQDLLPNVFKLIPGYGKGQGGGADGAVAVINDDGYGGIVNDSRGIDYAYFKDERFKCNPEDFADASAKVAEFDRDDLNAALKRAGKLAW
jgi:orotidine-5'-phosphate decarboxylase